MLKCSFPPKSDKKDGHNWEHAQEILRMCHLILSASLFKSVSFLKACSAPKISLKSYRPSHVLLLGWEYMRLSVRKLSQESHMKVHDFQSKHYKHYQKHFKESE